MQEKKHQEQPKGHTDEKRDWRKGFGRLEIEEDIRKGINKLMSHVERAQVVCYTKTVSGGEVGFVDNKGQGFEFHCVMMKVDGVLDVNRRPATCKWK